RQDPLRCDLRDRVHHGWVHGEEAGPTRHGRWHTGREETLEAAPDALRGGSRSTSMSISDMELLPVADERDVAQLRPLSAAEVARRRDAFWFDVQVLVVAVGVVALAFLLRVRSDQRVEFRGLPGVALPHVCAARVWLGLSCPGCGLTRSVISVAEGDWHG